MKTTIYQADKRIHFERGKEASFFTPLLVGTLYTNCKDEHVAMGLTKEELIVSLKYISLESWTKVIEDLKTWARLGNLAEKLKRRQQNAGNQ